MSSKRFGSLAAWSVGAISLASLVLAWVLAASDRDLIDLSSGFGPDRFMIGFTVVGSVLAARRRSNPVGWLLLALGLVTALRAVAGEYAVYALGRPSYPGHPGGVWAAWYVGWSLLVLFPAGLLALLLLLFPDGRPLSRRWRTVVWAAALLAGLSVAIVWLAPAPIVLGGGLPHLSNPTALRHMTGLASAVVGGGAWALDLVVLLAAVASVVLRYRRAGGDERLQLKWFAYATAVSLGLIFALLPMATMGNAGQVIYDLALVAGLGLALPVAIGVAVLKYRLYAIDRIISRTVSYLLVTGLVVGVYVGCVMLLTRVLPIRGSISVAVAVLAAAALVNPLRRRVQALVDRRFDRARYDAEQVIRQYSGRLRDEVDLDVLGADLQDVVQHVLAPTHQALWLHGTSDAAPGPKPRS